MKYPIGLQDFEKIRRGGFVYVDKTRRIYELASTGSYYFLGRPRRFGKSLLISTMEAYFKGKRELFKGLAMEELEKDWTEYPVLHLDLTTGKYNGIDDLQEVLDNVLAAWEDLYGTGKSEGTVALRFKGIVQRACEQTGHQVVILIDEYDKPLLHTFDKPAVQDEMRAELKVFYSVLKTQDRYIRFAFLTGVTKFGKVSVFSDLNNLNDISMDRNYADICGITEEEIHEYFKLSIQELAEANGMTCDEAFTKLRERYDGYHFRLGGPDIYNPFSLLCTFMKGEFKDYWFETGTPTFLIKMLQQEGYNLSHLKQEMATSQRLKDVDRIPDDPVPLLYQSGYLTIKGYDERFQTYQLGFPNKEVENGFINYLLPYYMPVGDREMEFSAFNFIHDIEDGDVEGFMRRLQTFFDSTHYRVAVKKEADFQSAMFIIFSMLGQFVTVEQASARGRVDIVMKTKDYIYVIECKFDGSADDALRQIEEKGYARPYEGDPRKLYKIGTKFSSGDRSISEWKIG